MQKPEYRNQFWFLTFVQHMYYRIPVLKNIIFINFPILKRGFKILATKPLREAVKA